VFARRRSIDCGAAESPAAPISRRGNPQRLAGGRRPCSDRRRRSRHGEHHSGLALLEPFDSIDLMAIHDASAVDAALKKVGR
jgi:hypothetical protein